MKKSTVYLGIVLIALLCIGCMGKDGSPGKTYLKVQLYNCSRYWDNNPGIPYGFSEYTFYFCTAGSYSFEYDTYDGWEWTGTYALAAEPGEPGQFMGNGKDGADRYYTLQCRSSGPSFTYYTGKSGTEKRIQPTHEDEDSVEIIHSDGVWRFHLKATRKPVSLQTGKTKLTQIK